MGPFARLSEKLADNPYWAENSIVTAAAIRRMGDVEFGSELLIGVLHGPQGGGASLIDQYYTQYEDFDDEFPSQKKASKTFEEALELIKKMLPDIKSSRWSNKTDFYSLFVALASAKDFAELAKKMPNIQKEIIDFGTAVDDAQAGEAKPAYIENYNTAIEKGANDKARRATRHEILVKRFVGAAPKAFA
jgi:hypothetical protein